MVAWRGFAAIAVAMVAIGLLWPRTMIPPPLRTGKRPTLAELARQSDVIVTGVVRRKVATFRSADGTVRSRWVVFILDRLNRAARYYPASEITVEHLGGRLGLLRYGVKGDPAGGGSQPGSGW